MSAEIIRKPYLWFATVLCLFAVACGPKSESSPTPEPQAKPVAEHLVPDVGDAWLSFELQGPEDHGNATLYHATYRAEGRVARFDFELNIKSPSADGLAFGRFVAVPGSDSSVLIRNLKTTLAGKKLPTGKERLSELPFAFILLGNDMSHDTDGGMSPEPRGHWTAMKLFIGHEKDDAEVFLNINLTLHKAEFSIKDEEYGDTLLRYLAKVL